MPRCACSSPTSLNLYQPREGPQTRMAYSQPLALCHCISQHLQEYSQLHLLLSRHPCGISYRILAWHGQRRRPLECQAETNHI